MEFTWIKIPGLGFVLFHFNYVSKLWIISPSRMVLKSIQLYLRLSIKTLFGRLSVLGTSSTAHRLFFQASFPKVWSQVSRKIVEAIKITKHLPNPKFNPYWIGSFTTNVKRDPWKLFCLWFLNILSVLASVHAYTSQLNASKYQRTNLFYLSHRKILF